MNGTKNIRYIIIALVLLLGVIVSFSSAARKESDYPNSDFIADAQWLKSHLKDKQLVVVDVRSDKHFTGSLIPGAIRLPWSAFRYNDVGNNLASTFVGIKAAQDILGRHGITRRDTLVLYDSVERDGGATASYLFWILDVLGHEKKMILERGIDGWRDAGFALVTEAREPDPLLYQAPVKEIRREKLIDGDFVYRRLGDYYYQIIDVRSAAEYLGEKGSKGLDGTPLKLGHIPTAVNINYEAAWTDPKTKDIKTYEKLRDLYKGLDPSRGVIVYCDSGRRSAFSYYILRLMGFKDVYAYEPSWKEWGNPDRFFPVEVRENKLAGRMLPEAGTQTVASQSKAESSKAGKTASDKPSDGYVSCGG